MNRVLCFSVLLLFTASISSVRAEKNWDLEYLLEYAEENSSQIKAQQMQKRASAEKAKTAGRWYRPNLYAEAGYGGAANQKESLHGPLARIVGEWILWDGGRTKAKKATYELQEKYHGYASELQKINTKTAVVSAYLSASAILERLELLEKQSEEYRKLMYLVGPRIRIGTAAAGDLRSLKTEWELLKEKRKFMEHSLSLHIKEIRFLAGMPDSESETGKSPEIIIVPLSEISASRRKPAEDVSDHPEIQMHRVLIQILDAELESYKREIYGPELSVQLFGGFSPYNDAIDPRRPEAGISAGVRYPIFQRESRKSAVNYREAQINAEKFKLEAELNRAALSYEKKSGELQIGNVSIERKKNIVQNSGANLSASYGEYRRGIVSTRDMISSVQRHYELKNEFLTDLMRIKTLQLENEIFIDYKNKSRKGD